MIKAVIFDWGGVVSSGGVALGVAQHLAAKLNISDAHAATAILPAWHEYVRGKTDEAGFWSLVEEHYGEPVPVSKRDIWADWSIMAPRPAILKLVEELKANGITVGLLSNINLKTLQMIRSHGGYEPFDPCILSAEAGYAKPDPEIYQLLLDSLPGIKPNEVLFIDDQEKCMPPAQALGINTILATDETEIIERVLHYVHERN